MLQLCTRLNIGGPARHILTLATDLVDRYEIGVAAGTAEPGATPATAVDSGFQVGPAITVEPNYEPPDDHVPSTGAHLPANGKPTLVYVDAIW